MLDKRAPASEQNFLMQPFTKINKTKAQQRSSGYHSGNSRRVCASYRRSVSVCALPQRRKCRVDMPPHMRVARADRGQEAIGRYRPVSCYCCFSGA